jgi:hypothetical protein
MKTFEEFIIEAKQLKPGMKFKTTDKTGDLAGVELTVKSIKR